MGDYVTARKNLKRSLQHRFEGVLQGNLTASGEKRKQALALRQGSSALSG